MATDARNDRPQLSGEDLGRLLKLIKGADSVELKLTVPAPDQVATIRRLPIDPVEAQPRQVFFFDTPDLALNAVGVVVRARRIQGGRADTRGQAPAGRAGRASRRAATRPCVQGRGRRAAGWVRVLRIAEGPDAPARKCALPSAASSPFAGSSRRTSEPSTGPTRPAGLELDALVPLGPTFILKTVFTPKSLGRPLVGEMWLYQDGSRILELSTKCQPAEAFQVAAEVRAYLAERGVSLTGEQQTKTKTALEFFARQRQVEAAATGA